MVVESITKRNFYTFEELRELLGYEEGVEIEFVQTITEYDKQSNAKVKNLDVIVTTVEDISPEPDK